jgi:hypothetical protein
MQITNGAALVSAAPQRSLGAELQQCLLRFGTLPRGLKPMALKAVNEAWKARARPTLCMPHVV